jgi:hypothetical protein
MVVLQTTDSSNHGRKVLQYEVKCSIGQRFNGALSTSIVKNPVNFMMLTCSSNATTGASGYISIRQVYSDVC